ncbi:MAG: hypothetical protein KDI13_07115 [Alphaproteobacteria bacterium]|nr:hypothetical protein [Alphaproteobacteria bacterium]
MKTKREHICAKDGENGNALVYVLIAIVLFAALGMTFMSQSRNDTTEELDDSRAELLATQMISYAAQGKSTLDQMSFSGTQIGSFNFTKPGESGYNTAPHIHKVYHPSGGGLLPSNIPTDAIAQVSSNPEPGWYMGRFNNVEWTPTTGTDIILTAFQISKTVCEKINEKVLGTTTIPILASSAKSYLVDATLYAGSNVDFNTSACAACEGYMSLCVQDPSGIYAFYNVLLDR